MGTWPEPFWSIPNKIFGVSGLKTILSFWNGRSWCKYINLEKVLLDGEHILFRISDLISWYSQWRHSWDAQVQTLVLKEKKPDRSCNPLWAVLYCGEQGLPWFLPAHLRFCTGSACVGWNAHTQTQPWIFPLQLHGASNSHANWLRSLAQ